MKRYVIEIDETADQAVTVRVARSDSTVELLPLIGEFEGRNVTHLLLEAAQVIIGREAE